ncbi:class I SAM-dependent methyltransferase [Pinibacter soli]|uniref:Methyltransferase n=1 Tax=Pinibacter soli TaxID=3044211 RepID=A0ABT6RIK7_9BACT|nr:methyltransferase [Pinibacter soli]MDI3322407.1 methyltransferase [Pinibacter soli]
MVGKLSLEIIEFGDVAIKLYVPGYDYVKQKYEAGMLNAAVPHFPYWAKIWPAAIGMCNFISAHTLLVKGRKVLELAAGLGLPSLLTAAYAADVCCSDYLQDAIDVIDRSVAINEYNNIHTRLLNWHHLPDDLHPDVLLMSDVNYDAHEFAILHKVVERFINSGTTIILSTPQRLMAKSFIGKLLPWVAMQQEMEISVPEKTFVSIFVLKKG